KSGIMARMTKAFEILPLREGMRFGARVRGLTRDAIADASVRDRLGSLFEAAGVVVFEEVEPTSAMHVAISSIAGPLKDHLQKSVARVDQDSMPGVDRKSVV